MLCVMSIANFLALLALGFGHSNLLGALGFGQSTHMVMRIAVKLIPSVAVMGQQLQ